MRSLSRGHPVGLALLALTVAASPLRAAISANDRVTADSLLSLAHDVMLECYWPRQGVGDAFEARCADARKRIAAAGTNNDAYAVIADTLASVDARIRFFPPPRSARPDYSWEWQLIGDAAYVTQIDRDGDAAKQGLKLGDRLVSFEGLPVDRGDYEQIAYAFNLLTPRAGLRVQVQSPGAEPRWLAIATTLRPARRTRTVMVGDRPRVEWVLTKREQQRVEEFKEVRRHQRRIGQVLVWHAAELRRASDDVADGLRNLKDATALILDLRGQYANRPEPAMRLLDGLFTESFDVGQVRRADGRHEKLRVRGSAGAFQGPVLVLVDARTAVYAEVLARVLQQRGRARIIGDRTMGRVLDEGAYSLAQGALYSVALAHLLLPTGEIVLNGEPSLDGRGVTPDTLLLPQPADLAAHRDPVLTQALRLQQETIAPEAAFQLFWVNHEDDELEP